MFSITRCIHVAQVLSLGFHLCDSKGWHFYLKKFRNIYRSYVCVYVFFLFDYPLLRRRYSEHT